MKILKHKWSDITITDYRKIKAIGERELDSELEKGIAILSVLCGVDENEVYNLPVMELGNMLNEISWIGEEFTFNKNYNAKHITINGVKYDVDVDINHFSVAQYADFQVYWDHRDDAEYMGRILSLFIKPHKCLYNDGYDIAELIPVLEDNVSVCDYAAICFFFLKDLVISTKSLVLYSGWLIRKVMRNTKDPETKTKCKNLLKDLQKAREVIG